MIKNNLYSIFLLVLYAVEMIALAIGYIILSLGFLLGILKLFGLA